MTTNTTLQTIQNLQEYYGELAITHGYYFEFPENEKELLIFDSQSTTFAFKGKNKVVFHKGVVYPEAKNDTEIGSLLFSISYFIDCAFQTGYHQISVDLSKLICYQDGNKQHIQDMLTSLGFQQLHDTSFRLEKDHYDGRFIKKLEELDAFVRRSREVDPSFVFVPRNTWPNFFETFVTHGASLYYLKWSGYESLVSLTRNGEELELVTVPFEGNEESPIRHSQSVELSLNPLLEKTKADIKEMMKFQNLIDPKPDYLFGCLNRILPGTGWSANKVMSALLDFGYTYHEIESEAARISKELKDESYKDQYLINTGGYRIEGATKAFLGHHLSICFSHFTDSLADDFKDGIFAVCDTKKAGKEFLREVVRDLVHTKNPKYLR